MTYISYKKNSKNFGNTITRYATIELIMTFSVKENRKNNK